MQICVFMFIGPCSLYMRLRCTWFALPHCYSLSIAGVHLCLYCTTFIVFISAYLEPLYGPVKLANYVAASKSKEVIYFTFFKGLSLACVLVLRVCIALPCQVQVH